MAAVRLARLAKDIGALARIRVGEIKVVPGVRRLEDGGAELVDGRFVAADAIILATGYHSNVPQWLKGSDFFNGEGYPEGGVPGGVERRVGALLHRLHAAGPRQSLPRRR